MVRAFAGGALHDPSDQIASVAMKIRGAYLAIVVRRDLVEAAVAGAAGGSIDDHRVLDSARSTKARGTNTVPVAAYTPSRAL